MCVLEVNNTGWPRHINRDQDEWIYVVDGEVELEIGKKRFRLGTRESMLIPRNIEHAWATVSAPAKIINTYQPAGKIEDFFQALAKFKDLPTREQAMRKATRPTDRRIEAGVRRPRHDCDWSTTRRLNTALIDEKGCKNAPFCTLVGFIEIRATLLE